MPNNKYKTAMNELKFSDDFCKNTVKAIDNRKKAQARKQRITRCVIGGLAACLCGAAVFVAALFLKSTDSNHTPREDIIENTPGIFIPAQENKTIVISSNYSGALPDVSAAPGNVVVEEGVQMAMDDPANKDAYYYVAICPTLPRSEQEKYTQDAYVYNGRSVSEWAVLADLANDRYPYEEYNGDFGGEISKEKWEAAVEEAKASDAQKNYEAAMEAYQNDIADVYEKAIKEWIAIECNRLEQAGYDVFLANAALEGLLTADQIQNFKANQECAYTIEWVRNEKGIVNWQEGHRPY